VNICIIQFSSASLLALSSCYWRYHRENNYVPTLRVLTHFPKKMWTYTSSAEDKGTTKQFIYNLLWPF